MPMRAPITNTSAGIQVRYCAEQFENDGSIASTIVKTVKRAMAGEYSRELSSKVFAGQARLIELGFRQGGFAGYGLRRRIRPAAYLSTGPLHSGQDRHNRYYLRCVIFDWTSHPHHA